MYFLKLFLRAFIYQIHYPSVLGNMVTKTKQRHPTLLGDESNEMKNFIADLQLSHFKK